MSRIGNLLYRFGIQARESTGRDAAVSGPLADVEFRIPNMVCEGCAEKLDEVLRSLAGVHQIRSNVAQKLILVRYEPTKVRREELKDAVRQAGFTAVET